MRTPLGTKWNFPEVVDGINARFVRLIAILIALELNQKIKLQKIIGEFAKNIRQM